MFFVLLPHKHIMQNFSAPPKKTTSTIFHHGKVTHPKPPKNVGDPPGSGVSPFPVSRGLGERIGLDQDTSQRRRHDRLPSGPPFLGLKNQSLLGVFCSARGSVCLNQQRGMFLNIMKHLELGIH